MTTTPTTAAALTTDGKHRVCIRPELLAGVTYWSAYCSCRWLGRPYQEQEPARADAIAHVLYD